MPGSDALAYAETVWMLNSSADHFSNLRVHSYERSYDGIWATGGDFDRPERRRRWSVDQKLAILDDIDPQAWLTDVLRRIADHPASRLHELLPWHWKKPDTQAAAA